MNTKHVSLIAILALVSACGGSGDAADSTSAGAKPSDLTLTPAQQARIRIDTVALTRFNLASRRPVRSPSMVTTQRRFSRLFPGR